MKVSIIVPCRNEERHIAACLDSILATTYPRDQLEVLVVDGASDDRTREIATQYAARHAHIRVLDNPKRIVPAALNIGIRAASGEVIVRMDAHVVYPPDYVSRLLAAQRRTGADNVGGKVCTVPADDSAVARAVAVALSHPFGVGNSYFRIGAGDDRWVDTVPFGCFRRDVFERVGLFDEELVRNQDDEFNHRLIRHGGRVLLVSDVVSRYYARSSLRQLGRMCYQYGLFKPVVMKKVGRVMTARQLVPAGFLLTLVGTGVAALVWPSAAVAWWLVVGGYLAALAACAMPAGFVQGPRCALALAAAFVTLHVSYGLGFLRGLFAIELGMRGRPRDPTAVPLSR
jgi:glycosyltransferase involved in cell wall biosynthesis